MHFNEKYDYIQLSRESTDGGSRVYVELNGNKVPSVTTILSRTGDKSGLKKWEERVGLVEATRIRNEAANLGTLMHHHLECHACGLERPIGNNFIRQLSGKMADQIIERGLVNVNEAWGMEISLCYPGLYAGTADLCGVHKGDSAIMDYKTAKKMKTREMIEDYFLQLSAYAMCHNEQYGTDIKKGVIFMVDRDLKFQEFILEGNDFQAKTDSWLRRLETFLLLNQS